MTATTILIISAVLLTIAAIAIRLVQVNNGEHFGDNELNGDASPILAPKS
jgi:hypothetical protein